MDTEASSANKRTAVHPDPDGLSGQDRPAPTPIHRVIGLIALAGAIAATIAVITSEPPAWTLRLASAASALMAGWLLTWRRRWPIQLSASLGLGLLAAGAFSIPWHFVAWPVAGAAIGCVGSWSYDRRGRARLTSLTLLAAAYVLAAAAGILQVTRGASAWWLIGLGLASLLCGWLLVRVSNHHHHHQQTGKQQDRPPAADQPIASLDPQQPSAPQADAQIPPADVLTSKPTGRENLRTAGRLLITCGILLPYLGLVAYTISQVMR